MDNARQQIVDSIKKSSNILVAVSSDPSVDELSAALGLSIILNNMDKRATAVFSGAVPPAIEFLEPGKTFENSADSLRDFIIALNKEKADHLRYKVEGDVVKIFITPYKTKLSQDDLEFSQGDYNVDMVLALGVKDQGHLDKALEAHGKILHDATVVTITAGNDASSLGSLDWHDATASSLCEMSVSLADGLKGEGPILNEQIATAFLTCIVSATARFSNDRTTSRAMTMAAQLMAAGANQQLIAAKLEEGKDLPPKSVAPTGNEAEKKASSENDNGLTIEREKKPEAEPVKEEPPQEAVAEQPAEKNTEDVAQDELEKNLAGLTAAPAEKQTLEDIENELKQATQELVGSEPMPPSGDNAAPEAPIEPSLPPLSTEPEPALVSEPVPAPDSTEASEMPPLPPLPPIVGPEEQAIVNEHGTFAGSSATNIPPLNSIQTNPLEGEPPAIDPFAQTPAHQEAAPVPPSLNVGTPEGAALLASEPVSAVQPAPNPVTIPELPPLPPLPPDVSLPPLPPPPPPPPTLGQPPLGSQAGPVSGDVFGDGSNSGTTPPAPTTPSEPGQFKIPGSSV